MIDTFIENSFGDITAVVLEPLGRHIVVGDSQGKINIIDYITGARVKSMDPHTTGMNNCIINTSLTDIISNHITPKLQAQLFGYVTSLNVSFLLVGGHCHCKYAMTVTQPDIPKVRTDRLSCVP